MNKTKQNQYTIVDIFAGVGGLSLGFQQLGFKIALANDNDKEAAETFIHNHPGTNFYIGDVKNLDRNKLKKYVGKQKIDILVGGIPCQSFSMVGFRTTQKEAHLFELNYYNEGQNYPSKFYLLVDDENLYGVITSVSESKQGDYESTLNAAVNSFEIL